jgi:5'-nucleotidase
VAWTEVHWSDLPGAAVHSVDLPPAAAVYAGCLGAFGARPDIVASGVNPGLNYGHLVIHSGTVGAALTAAVLGIPAIAVSLAWGEHEEWMTAASLAGGALAWLATASPGTVLNLNVPNVPAADVLGVRPARLGPFNEAWSATTSAGELLLEYVGHEREPDPDTDLAVVRSGYAAVTVLGGPGVDDERACAAADAIATANGRAAA